MANDLWRWADPNGQQRTVRLDELRAALAGGVIAPNTPVWRSGWSGWQAAHEVPELSSASVGGANGVVLNIPPPPLAMVAVQQEYEAKSNSVVPVAPASGEEEPPPPPPYVPSIPLAGSGQAAPLATQLAGSAYVPNAAASHAPAPPTQVSPSSPPSAGPRKLGPSLPTAIGLAPPPELFAIAEAARPPKSMPPPVPKPVVPVEELSGSSLLDDASSPALERPGANGLPPPTNPVVHDIVAEPDHTDVDEIPDFAQRRGLGVLVEDLKGLRAGRAPKNKAMLAAAGVLGFATLVLVVAGVVSLFSGGSSSRKPVASAASAKPVGSSASVTTAKIPAPPQSVPPPPAAVPPPAQEEPSGLGDCASAGDAKSIAPKAIIASGVEAHALTTGLGLGFAAGPRDAIATLLDPKTLSPQSTVRAKVTGGDAKRVTPMLNGAKLSALADVERKSDKLTQRRLVPTTHPVDIGWADGAIVSTPHGKDTFAKLFPMESDIEVLRGTPLADRRSIALVFRRGSAIHVGSAKGDGALAADGDLSKIASAGQVGTPAIAASGDHVIIAWAERAGANDDWKIRWTKMKPGGAPDEPSTFTPPDGGLGSHAMSPSVAGLGGGRFLLAWTEGPVSSHQVRAVTIGADGATAGSAIAVSAAGVNAGQPAAVVGSDGHGAVAFIAAKGKALELWAAPIACAKR